MALASPGRRPAPAYWYALAFSVAPVLIGNPSALAAQGSLASGAAGPTEVPTEVPLGVGIASPALDPARAFYFYGPPTEGVLPSEMTPVDSLTFTRGEHYVDIATAPPWFVPEALKLDYDILLLRVVTLSRDLIEVVVNGTNGQTAWVARDAVGFASWPAFLLEVFSVEVPEEIDNPVRVKALDYAGPVRETSEPLRPLAVQGDWIEVTSEGLRAGPVVRGWIRWHDGARLTLRYSLLS